MRLPVAVLILSASLSSVEAQNRISVRGPKDVLDRFAGLREALSRWHPDLEIEWSAYEGGVSFAGLFDGSVDLLVSSRAIDRREEILARELSLEIHEHVAGLDAIAVVVHPDNFVESLTLEQIRTLFSGKIVGWYGYGGSDRPVRILAPMTSSGEYQALRRISPGGNVRFPSAAELVPASAEVLSTVASDPRAVGLVSMALDRSKVRTVPLRTTSSDVPLVPSADSVERGEYPWERFLWLYRRGSGDESLLRLLSSLLSSDGQAEIAKAGFVALVADRAFHRTLPSRERSRGAAVTSVRFAPGTARLDRASERSLAELSTRAAEVWITAHAELDEDRRIPEERARALERFLTARGVSVTGAEWMRAAALAPPSASGDFRRADVLWVSRR